MAPRKADEGISRAEAGDFLASLLTRQARTPNVHAYKPHEKQLRFHQSTKRRKLYIGGNRSGKTHGGVVEDIWRLSGNHPYRSVPPAPVRGRAVCVDFRQGIEEILIPKFQQLMPPSLLKGGSWDRSYNKQEKKLVCANGSTLEFMTYEQAVDAFAGTSRHFVHFDEEPPKAIYNECMARLVDTKGDAYMTMTPLLGMTWVYDELYEPGLTGEHSSIEVITVDITENPYLDEEAVQEYLDSITDPEEKKARKQGKFINLGGLVYKEFSKEKHVIPYTDDLMSEVRRYELSTSMDHGYNAPTAWLWHGVAADGTIVTFAEHYKSEMTVGEHAQKVKEVEAKLKIEGKVGMRIADPATAQRQGVTGTSIQTEYALNDIDLSPGNNDVSTGVAKIQQYLKINPATKKPYWLIAESCPNLIREMQRLRWATYSSTKMQSDRNPQEAIHKKDDHACDSARYFFSFMPDLTPDAPPRVTQVPKDTATERFDRALIEMTGPVAERAIVWSESTDTLTSWEYE